MKENKVVSLDGGAVNLGEPCPETISLLKMFLEHAEAGDVVGVTVVGYHRDHTVSQTTAGAWGTYRQIGALEEAKMEHLNYLMSMNDG